MELQREKSKAILLMVICALMWSTGGILIKMIPWSPAAIAGVRAIPASAVVYLYMKKAGFKIKLTKSSVISGLFLTGVFFCFVTANKMTTSANAIVLQFTSPVFILLLSVVFLHKKFTRADLITVVVTLGGISLFFLDQLSPGNMVGNMLAIFSGLLQASAFVIVGEVDEDTRMTGILLGQVFAVLIGTPIFFLEGTNVITPSAVGFVMALGTFQLGIPYVLFGLAMKNCSALACNLIGAIEPIFNPVWVFLFDGERPGFYALVGGAVVISAVSTWCVVSDRQTQNVQVEAEKESQAEKEDRAENLSG